MFGLFSKRREKQEASYREWERVMRRFNDQSAQEDLEIQLQRLAEMRKMFGEILDRKDQFQTIEELQDAIQNGLDQVRGLPDSLVVKCPRCGEKSNIGFMTRDQRRCRTCGATFFR